MALLRIGIVALLYGVSVSTIRRWEASGLIGKAVRTLGGHRRFEVKESTDDSAERKDIGYARVSSHDQREDQQRQVDRLKEAGCEEVITDLGSGLNCRKPGLRSVMRELLHHKIRTLTVTHEDRLLRFGVDLVREVCRHVKTELRVLSDPASTKTFEEELARDVITLMTVFCARLYGRRSRRNSKMKHADSNDVKAFRV